MNEPDVILADERPEVWIAETRRSCTNSFLTCATSWARHLLFVTHDEELAATTDRTIHLKDGKIDD